MLGALHNVVVKQPLRRWDSIVLQPIVVLFVGNIVEGSIMEAEDS